MATQEELLQQTQTYRDQAKTYSEQASVSNTLALSAKAGAITAQINAETAASAAGQAVVDATYQGSLAVGARDAAVVARNESLSARSVVLTKADEAASSAASALSSLNQIGSSVIKAQNWAEYPLDQTVPGEAGFSAYHWAETARQTVGDANAVVTFGGGWDAATYGTPDTPANSVRYVIISDGIVDGKNVYEGDSILYSVPDAEWFVLSGQGAVTSVNTKIGAVVLDYSDFAGAQHIVLNNAVQIQGRTTTTGTYAIGRVGSDNRIRLGDENSAGLALQSPSEPYWTDGVTSRTLVHSGGGQTIGGVNFTGSVSMANNFGYYGKKTDGSWTLVGLVDSSNRTRFGNSALQTRIDSLAAPQFHNGTATYDLIHAGGGQSIASDLIVGSARLKFTGATAFTPSNGTNKTWAMVENLNGAENLGFAMRGDDATDRMSFFTDYNSSGTYTERLTIMASNGRVGINNTAPGYQLDVNGDGYFGGGLTVIGSGTIGAANFNSGWLKIGNATTGWAFDSNEIFSTGTATIGTLAGNLNLTPVGNLVINGAATTVNNAMTVNGTLTLGDAQTIRMGASNDLQLQHNGTHSYLDNYTGALYLRQLDSAQNLTMQVKGTDGTTVTVAQCQGGTAAPYFRAFSDGAEKFRTQSSGLLVYGTLGADDVALSGGGTFGADIVSNAQNAGIQFNYVANAATPAYDSAGSSITGGADFAGLGKRNNIDVQTWYGFSVSPTYGSGTVARGTPAFSVDARSGISYMANGLYIAGGAAWHSGNFNPSNYLTTGGKAADSELLDGIDSSRVIYGGNSTASTQLSSSWDEPAKSGFYDGDSKTNAPTASGWYWGLFASHSNAGSYGWSLVSNNSTNPTLYLRGKAANSWGNWNTVMTSNLSNFTFGGQLILSKSGSSDNIMVGDDVWLGDGNKANTVFVKGNQNSDRGFIIFGSSTSNKQLGAIGTGDLTWGGDTVWHAGNVATKGSIPAANNSSTAGTGFGGFRYTISGSTLNLFTT